MIHPGDRIPGIPEHTVTARVVYTPVPACTIGTTLAYRSATFPRGDENNGDAHGTIGGYVVLDADAEYRLTRHPSVFATVTNLLDARHATLGVLGTNGGTAPPIRSGPRNRRAVPRTRVARRRVGRRSLDVAVTTSAPPRPVDAPAGGPTRSGWSARYTSLA